MQGSIHAAPCAVNASLAPYFRRAYMEKHKVVLRSALKCRRGVFRRGDMTQTSNRLLDEFAKLMTDMAGVAQGVRREVETAFRSQAERFLSEMDLVSARGIRRRARHGGAGARGERGAEEADRGAGSEAWPSRPTSRSRSSAARASATGESSRGRRALKRGAVSPWKSRSRHLAPLSRADSRIYSGSNRDSDFCVKLEASLVRSQASR